MATNLRLRPDAEEAVRAESRRSGRPQQEIIRAAVDRYLGLAPAPATSELDALVAAGAVRPPRTPYRKARRRITLPDGMTSTELLKRDDRL